jgi:GDP-L-fucose synthase
MKCLYLVQTAGKCPQYDVESIVVLSYKENTEDTDIFLPNSTWTTGRNALVEYARKQAGYDYYIFMDDDIILDFKKFEAYLEEFKPLIGVPNYDNDFDYYNKTGVVFPDARAQTVTWFDAMCCAYTREALDSDIFPYVTRYDETNWWASQYIHFAKCAHVYPKRVVLFPKCLAQNINHSSYPQSANMDNIRLEELIPEYNPSWGDISGCTRISLRCLYLVQTASKCPYNLENIVVLSYKEQTSDTTIFMPNSTWTTGRNALVEYAKSQKGYDYYIFLDEDLDMDFNEFERYLEEYRPLIGVPFYQNFHPADKHYYEAISLIIPEPSQKTCWFDGMCCAYTREALESSIFPYVQDYDNHNWWASQYIHIALCAHTFPGRVTLFPKCIAKNNQHSEYPRNGGVDYSYIELQKYIPNYNPRWDQKVLVTGGSGLVGKALQKMQPNWHYITSETFGSLTNEENVKKLFKDCKFDAVVHLAANVGGMFKNMNRRQEMFEDNILMNTFILREAARQGVPRVITMLSTCIFPDAKFDELSPELLHEGPPHPSNEGYAYAKRVSEVHARIIRETTDTHVTCLIPTNVYGPHDNFSLEDGHVIPALIHRASLAKENGTPLQVKGSGKALRQFIHADDLAMIIIWAIQTPDKPPPMIVCANNQEYTIGQAAQIIADAYGVRLEFIGGPDGQLRKYSRPGTTDIPRIPFDQGLRDTCAWFEANKTTCRT